jgi:hypothetical protein
MSLFRSDPRIAHAKNVVRANRIRLRQSKVEVARARSDLKEAKNELSLIRVQVRESKNGRNRGYTRNRPRRGTYAAQMDERERED